MRNKNIYLCIHTPSGRLEAICSSLTKAKLYNELQVRNWKAIPEEHIIVKRKIDEDLKTELNYGCTRICH